jgi:nucleotide-binding universal stress UspA family protein
VKRQERPKASAIDFLASRLAAAAINLARMTKEIEDAAQSAEGLERETSCNRVIEYSAAAVVMSVAAVEATVNELLGMAERRIRPKLSVFAHSALHSDPIPQEAHKKWAAWWKLDGNERADIATKIDAVLEGATGSTLNRGRGIGQDIKLLIALRNDIVHAKPSLRPFGRSLFANERDKLEQGLRSKFLPNSLVPKHAPYLWHECLGSGCARWAVLTEAGMTNELFERVGVRIRKEPQL